MSCALEYYNATVLRVSAVYRTNRFFSKISSINASFGPVMLIAINTVVLETPYFSARKPMRSGYDCLHVGMAVFFCLFTWLIIGKIVFQICVDSPGSTASFKLIPARIRQSEPK
jgi:hypothetical protein